MHGIGSCVGLESLGLIIFMLTSSQNFSKKHMQSCNLQISAVEGPRALEGGLGCHATHIKPITSHIRHDRLQ